MKKNDKKKSERKREKSAYSRLWYRLKPSFIKNERKFYCEHERRTYKENLQRLRARASMGIPA